MSWMQDLVEQFHKKHRHPVFHQPVQLVELPAQLKLARVRLIVEEASEFVTAVHENDTVSAADALADLLYVTFGAALTFGFPMDEIFREVHASNMSKIPLNEHGKGGKGGDYQPPNVAGILLGRHRARSSGGVPDPAGYDAKPICTDSECALTAFVSHTTADPRCHAFAG